MRWLFGTMSFRYFMCFVRFAGFGVRARRASAPRSRSSRWSWFGCFGHSERFAGAVIFVRVAFSARFAYSACFKRFVRSNYSKYSARPTNSAPLPTPSERSVAPAEHLR